MAEHSIWFMQLLWMICCLHFWDCNGVLWVIFLLMSACFGLVCIVGDYKPGKAQDCHRRREMQGLRFYTDILLSLEDNEVSLIKVFCDRAFSFLVWVKRLHFVLFEADSICCQGFHKVYWIPVIKAWYHFCQNQGG